MLFTIKTGLDAAYYGVRIYSQVLDPRLNTALDDLPGDDPGRLFRLFSTLLRSIRRFETEGAVPGSCSQQGMWRQCFAGCSASSGTEL